MSDPSDGDVRELGAPDETGQEAGGSGAETTRRRNSCIDSPSRTRLRPRPRRQRRPGRFARRRPFSLSGYVLKGPVSGASVTASKLHGDLSAGDSLASTKVGDDGFFGLTLTPPTTGTSSWSPPAEPTPRRHSHPSTTVSCGVSPRTRVPWRRRLRPQGAGNDGERHADLSPRRSIRSLPREPRRGGPRDTGRRLRACAHFGNGPGVSPVLDWATSSCASCGETRRAHPHELLGSDISRARAMSPRTTRLVRLVCYVCCLNWAPATHPCSIQRRHLFPEAPPLASSPSAPSRT